MLPISYIVDETSSQPITREQLQTRIRQQFDLPLSHKITILDWFLDDNDHVNYGCVEVEYSICDCYPYTVSNNNTHSSEFTVKEVLKL